MRTADKRQGLTLIEVVIALAILAVGGLATVRVVNQSARAVTQAQRAEDDVTRASAFLNAVTLWTTSDLDRHLGNRTQGDWRMYVEAAGGAYSIALFDSTGRRRLVATTLYRRTLLNETANAP